MSHKFLSKDACMRPYSSRLCTHGLKLWKPVLPIYLRNLNFFAAIFSSESWAAAAKKFFRGKGCTTYCCPELAKELVANCSVAGGNMPCLLLWTMNRFNFATRLISLFLLLHINKIHLVNDRTKWLMSNIIGNRDGADRKFVPAVRTTSVASVCCPQRIRICCTLPCPHPRCTAIPIPKFYLLTAMAICSPSPEALCFS